MKNELIKYHQEELAYRQNQKLAYDAAEGGDWSRERKAREDNDHMIRFHQNAIEFILNGGK